MSRTFFLASLLSAAFLAPVARAADESANPRPQGPPLAGVVLITHGDTISHLGPIIPQHAEQLRKLLRPNLAVGYKYSYWGIFWLDLWTWGGEYCVYEGKNYDRITPAQAAQLLGINESDLGKPFSYRFPLGLVILLGIVVLIVLVALFAPKAPPDPAAALFQDQRYLDALNIFSERLNSPAAPAEGQPAPQPVPPAEGAAPVAQPAAPADGAPTDATVAAFEAGVRHLTTLGIAREEAERNLAAMVTRVTAATGQ